MGNVAFVVVVSVALRCPEVIEPGVAELITLAVVKSAAVGSEEAGLLGEGETADAAVWCGGAMKPVAKKLVVIDGFFEVEAEVQLLFFVRLGGVVATGEIGPKLALRGLDCLGPGLAVARVERWHVRGEGFERAVFLLGDGDGSFGSLCFPSKGVGMDEFSCHFQTLLNA